MLITSATPVRKYMRMFQFVCELDLEHTALTDASYACFLFPDTNVQRLCRVSSAVGEAIRNVKEGRITRHSESCQTCVTRLELVSDYYLFLLKK